MIRVWRRIAPGLRTPEGAVGAALCLLVVALAAFGPLVAPDNPNAIDLRDKLAAPSAAHPFGTDELGRDLLSRVLDGAPRTIVASVLVIAVALVVGVTIGMAAGYFGGFVDELLMRVTDVFLGFPALLFAIAVASALGPGLVQAVIALIVVVWPGYARLVRGQTRSMRHLAYVDAARVSGVPRRRIIASHVFPNICGPVLVKATLDVGLAVEAIAALGFIGVGSQPPAAEWGSMIAQSETFALQAWWYPLFPGLALALVVFGANMLGDAFARALGGNGARRSRKSPLGLVTPEPALVAT